MTIASSRVSFQYFEHNSCAVKFHAYTLDNSCDLASAVQHYLAFPQARMKPGLTPGRLEALKNFLQSEWETLCFALAT
jgi:hypothetical protein